MLKQPERHRAGDWYTVAVFAAGAAAFLAAFYVGSIELPAALLAVVLLVVVSEHLNVNLYFEGRVSLSFVGLVLAALSFGVAGTAIVASVIALTGGYFYADRSLKKLMFNFGQQNLAGFAAAQFALAVGVSGGVSQLLMASAYGAAVATGLFFVTSVAVAIAMGLTSRRSIFEIHRSQFAWLFPHYAVLGVVGGGLAATIAHLGVPGLLVLVAPLGLSRYAIKQMVDRTRDNVLHLEKSNDELTVAFNDISVMSTRLDEAYTGTLESLVEALDMRDQETRGHSNRVASHSLDLAKLLGMNDKEDLDMVYRGALMHDVGKIGVPDAILLKPGPLTEEEWEFMRLHPADGYRILARVPYLRPAADVVLSHHERWDGDGYPRQLKGSAIPQGARIFSLSDTFDAIVSDRPYRDGRTPDEALAEILRCAGSQFDPEVVEAFESLFSKWRDEHFSGDSLLHLPAWKDGGDETRRAAS